MRKRVQKKASDPYVNTITPKPRKGIKNRSVDDLEKRGWYRVQSIAGHRVVKTDNKDNIDLKVFWEGYKEHSWEGFVGFSKDTAEKCERYMLRSVILPFM